MEKSRMPTIRPDMTPQDVVQACDGYYRRPPHGPLVGYAGLDEEGKQFIGEVFVNFAKVEQWPTIVRRHVATPLRREIKQLCRKLGVESPVFCGAPEGGKVLATLLADMTGCRYGYPDKIVTELKTPKAREKSRLEYNRHEIHEGDEVILVEDVCNNFSTTGKLINEINARGGRVIAILCFLNRSTTIHGQFVAGGVEYPIIALWDEAMAEYRQGDPAVAADIAANNVVWKPKNEWSRLMDAMAQAS